MTETVDPDQARLEATCSCGDSFVSCDVPDDDERAEFDDWQAAHEHCGADHNHGCTFSWCINEIGSHEANRLEHFSATEYVPATADSRCGIPDKVHTADLPTIGVGVRFNEDLDPSPTVYLHIQGGWQRRDVDSEMRLDEAFRARGMYRLLWPDKRGTRRGTWRSPVALPSITSAPSAVIRRLYWTCRNKMPSPSGMKPKTA